VTKLLTPEQVAAYFGVHRSKVYVWCKSGQLAAIDASEHLGKKPRYRIKPSAVREFEQRRTAGKPTVKRRRQRLERVEQIV
jgi:excisionase family DNA binding protein